MNRRAEARRKRFKERERVFDGKRFGSRGVAELEAGAETETWWKMPAETPYLAVSWMRWNGAIGNFAGHYRRLVFTMRSRRTRRGLLCVCWRSWARISTLPALTNSCFLELGAAPARSSFGNTAKRAADIQLAYNLGVRHFTADSAGEIEKLI